MASARARKAGRPFMLKKLKSHLSSVRFRNKVILVFAVILFLIITVIVIQQIYLNNRLRFKDTRDNLSLVTEQVGINFSTLLQDQEIRLYNAMKMFDLPLLIRRSESQGRTADVQLALNQMLSTTSPFDFLMILTPKEVMLSATTLRTGNSELASEAAGLLLTPAKSDDASCQWHRGRDGDIYLVRDIYDTSPLTHCGRIVAHLKDDSLFSLGEQSRELEYTFLFFTPSGRAVEPELLFTAGLENDSLLDDLALLSQQGRWDQPEVTINGSEYFASQITYNGVKTMGLAPLGRVQRSNAAVARSVAVCGIAGLAAGVFALLVSMQRLMRQLNNLTNAMDNLASGHLDQTIPVVSEDDIGQLTVHFNDMSHKISLLLQRVVKEETLKVNAQFKLLEYQYRSLQTQLNPHFIFNSLEAINAMAKVEGNPELSRSILRISHYFRLITGNMNRQFITVGEELESLEDYAQIHQTIQGSRLQVTFFCEPAARAAVIPTMSLQPILENSLVHGLCTAPEISVVCVSARLADEKHLLLAVQDNGPGITPQQQELLLSKKQGPAAPGHTGVGLRNIIERLDLLYGTDARVKIDSRPGSTCISVTLPLSYENPMEFDQTVL